MVGKVEEIWREKRKWAPVRQLPSSGMGQAGVPIEDSQEDGKYSLKPWRSQVMAGSYAGPVNYFEVTV